MPEPRPVNRRSRGILVITLPFRLLYCALLLLRFLVEWLLLWPFVLLRRRTRCFVQVDIKGNLEITPPRGFFTRRRETTTYNNVVRALSRVESDPRVEGVLVRLSRPRMGLVDAILLRRRLERLRSTPKRVVCHFDAGGPIELVVAGAADQVYMSPGGDLGLFGLKAEITFLRDLLARLGLRGQFYHIGRYKTAGNLFTRNAATRAQHRMTTSLLDSIDGIVRSLVGPPTVDPLRPTYTAAQARQAGLIHHQAYLDQVAARLRAETDQTLDPLGHFGDLDRMKTIQERLDACPPLIIRTASEHARQRPHPFQPLRLFRARREVAVVCLSGIIVTETGLPGPLARRPQIHPEAVAKVLQRLERNPRVQAVVLYIDSRGGTMVATDLVWRSIWQLRQKKTVIACLGPVAASGGYYIALPAHEILSYPSTLTGSIGVVSGKISAADGLARLKIGQLTLVKSPFATMPSLLHPLTGEQVDSLRSAARSAYRRFVNRVASARNLPRKRVHRIARGRVYTGVQAARVGLVDAIGTLDDAVRRAAEKAGIPWPMVRIRYYSPQRPGFFRLLSTRQQPEPGWWESISPSLIDAAEFCWLSQTSSLLAYWDGRLSLV